MGIKGKRGKVVKGGKKGKSERVAERKKKEEDSEGPGAAQRGWKKVPWLCYGWLPPGGWVLWLCCGRLPPEGSVGGTGGERR